MYVRAANMFKMAKNWSAAGNAFSQAAHLHLQMDNKLDGAINFLDAGNAFKKADPQEAINCLNQAIEIYTNMAVSPLQPNTTYLLLRSTRYQKAIDIYEQIGTYAMDSVLLKYCATDHFFKAALCHFCVDMLNARLSVQRYEDMFPAFSDARECKLVRKLLDAYEEQDVDAFTDAVKDFDSIPRLGQWNTTMLLRIKKQIQDDESDLR
ncbi:hypothetical protein J4Q44_G00243290 [Coregonus suidteri]|uniref:Uncharacterized protein n=1 Tax=Coregonus suidteri TaxID=861788 RepID=A0AAN8LAW3_9TELE